MKNIKYTAVAFALSSVFLVGCNDLDTEPMGSTITSEQKGETVEANPAMVEASVTGITASVNLYGNAIGDSFHNDFGFGALMMGMDSRGTDMVCTDIGYNWFTSYLTFEDLDNTYVLTYNFWNTMYNQIYSANAVAKTIALDTEDKTLQYYLAQALAIRAFDYFNLAQMYQHTYVGNEEAPCVPVLTDLNADEAAANGCPRSTVKDTYAQIMSDLDNAIRMLESTDMTRPDNRYVSKEVAYGLRARVNLVMNNWAAAAADAEKAIAGSAAPLSMTAVSAPGFTEIEDWMWGILIAETDRVVTTGICNFPSHMGSLNYGYASVGAWRQINKKLYNSIPDTDVRKGWFLDANKVSASLSPDQQAYVAANNCPAYTQVKYAPYQGVLGTSTNASDIPLMRVEEMYLILAEAQAMSGNATQGAATLENFVKTYRDPAYKCLATTPADVQNAVWMQRRVELWGEGFSYFDLMRLKKPLDRRGGGFQAAYVFNIPTGDATLVYRIPECEEQANALLGDNNPVAERPTPVADEE